MSSPRTSFFYDRQIRRFLQQFIRILSNFQVELAPGPAGEQVLQAVPVFYGDASRQASQILRSNSENAIKSVPAMAVHINALNYDQKRTQEPNFVSKINVRTQGVDPVTGLPNGKAGDVFTVERLRPVPYNLTLKVDVWTSNTEQKLMLLEQIMVLFNPAFEIQSTDNYIDWTSLSYVLLTGIDWTNRRKLLVDLVAPYRTDSNYEIVIGVSGGKDSYFQTHFAINELGLKPLLVTYHGNNYLPEAQENLDKMRKVFDIDHIVVRPSEDSLIASSKDKPAERNTTHVCISRPNSYALTSSLHCSVVLPLLELLLSPFSPDSSLPNAMNKNTATTNADEMCRNFLFMLFLF